MHYTQTISSPLGNILLSADEVGLTGLWFDGGRYYAETLPEEHVERETPILMDTKRWLDVYFTGREPDFTPPLHPAGSAFRMTIWRLLLQIPYGQTTTYGELAKRLECDGCRRRRSAARSGIIPSASSFRAIGLSARTAA